MTINVSPEAEAKVRQIPDFSVRLERFIDDQFELEQWRKRRNSPEAEAIVDEALGEGAILPAGQAGRDVLFARLRSLTETLSHGK